MNAILSTGIFGILMLLVSLFMKNKRATHTLALLAVMSIGIVNYQEMYNIVYVSFPGNFFEFDRFSLYFFEILVALAFIYIALNTKSLEDMNAHLAETYSLILFSMCGLAILCFYNNLLSMFLGIEMLSLPLYILAALDKHNLNCIEASVKYFLLGAFTTGFLLLGIAFIYGSNGSFGISLDPMNSSYSFLIAAGLLLIFISFAFKVSAAPFHFWAPDVYDGAPTVITGFMASISKMGALYAFIKLFLFQSKMLGPTFPILLSFLIIASFIFGNITALFQQSIKRMLAYSSIAQVGFMLLILYLNPNQFQEPLLMYTMAYSVANICIFAIISKLPNYSFQYFNGFAKRQPFLAFALSLSLLSLAGIPLTAGFMSKFFVLKELLLTHVNLIWLAIVAVLFSVISISYYLKLIQVMYFKSPEDTTTFSYQLNLSQTFKYLLLIICIIIIYFGIFPFTLFNFYYFF
ncbi:MAG: NADH-quinone oxidoreductase subunit N [Alphaproteobacteria bacterium]|nr:NADH-quinone oxidoreductase subunit N [Alphaproteobacteria bacterium]